MKESFKIQNNSEHLAEGVKPIMVCVGSFEDFGIKENQYPKDAKIYEINFSLKDSKYINIDIPEEKIKEDELLSAGEQTYVISEIDDLDKFSNRFHRCTGLIVTGIDKNNGKNISFVSHQDPFAFLLKNKEKFLEDVQKRLKEMKERCRIGTIDAVIVGGIFYNDFELDNFQVMETYEPSIKLLNEETFNILGFKPIVVNGPKTSRIIGDDIYYDNKNRRLYFLRPKVNHDTKDFNYDEIEEIKKKWG